MTNKSKKASEVVGELRRIKRMFDIFSDAEDIITVLVEQEARKTALSREVGYLKADREKLENKLKEILDAIDEGKTMLEDQETEAHNIIKRARSDGKAMVAKAKERADKASAAGMAELESIHNQITKSTEEKIAINKETNDTSKKLDELKLKLSKIKTAVESV